MSHVEPDVLTLRAFDEPIGADARTHLEACDRCRAELAMLRLTVALARERWSEEVPAAPPAALWGRIVAALPDDDGAALAPTVPHGTVLRRRRTWWAAAAALTAFAIGGVVAIALQQPGPALLASTELEPLADVDPGRAQLVETPEGLALEVDVTVVQAVDGFYELWLLDLEATRLVSLGPLEGTGPHLLPAGLDPAELPVVDISLEPFDGDPTHSGDSLLRGVLEDLDGTDPA